MKWFWLYSIMIKLVLPKNLLRKFLLLVITQIFKNSPISTWYLHLKITHTYFCNHLEAIGSRRFHVSWNSNFVDLFLIQKGWISDTLGKTLSQQVKRAFRWCEWRGRHLRCSRQQNSNFAWCRLTVRGSWLSSIKKKETLDGFEK